ncbi:hypothetical protein MICAH_5560009 [Microcystis aeruginosa PCC 9809]|uniref:Uncharacterized protein n=1 Tax=Microcystis aeruginosa PCC 9809 TaxID=1160285 RepID=I4I4I5_MICAE|nr:hypothetical protein MICAH_5560009 [Microcystis aeruginosa PCC 9809]
MIKGELSSILSVKFLFINLVEYIKVEIIILKSLTSMGFKKMSTYISISLKFLYRVLTYLHPI